MRADQVSIEGLAKLTVRYILTILSCIAIALLVSGALLFMQKPVYMGQTTAFVGVKTEDQMGSSAEYTNTILAQTKLKSYIPLFTSEAVAQRVIDSLGLGMTPAALAQSIQLERGETVTVGIRAYASDPAQAQAISDAVVQAVGEEVQRLEPSSSIKIEKVSSAAVSTSPVSPSKKQYLGAGFLFGVALGYLIALLRSRYDTKIRTGADIEERVDASVLGILPDAAGIQNLEFSLEDDFRTREALRKIRTNLRYANVDKETRSLVVTSSTMGEGKSSVATFLAGVMAEAGMEVLLIDTDLRRPTVATKFKVDGSLGLTQVLAGITNLEQAVQRTSIKGLSIMPAGEVPANPSEVIGSKRMQDLVSYLSKRYFVILDAPPVLPVTDAILLSRICDGVMVVIAAGKTTYQQVETVIESIRNVNGKVLGTVLNRASTKLFSRIAYGDAEYGYKNSVWNYSRAENEYTTKQTDGGERAVEVEWMQDQTEAPALLAADDTGAETKEPARHAAGSADEATLSASSSAETALRDSAKESKVIGESGRKSVFPSRREWLNEHQSKK